MQRSLLIVDDEDNIIRSLQRLFRRDGYEIHTANSGMEGLEVLTRHEVGVVVSDQRMPEMSGIEFLSKVKDLYPDTIRMVLSGYTDLKTITEAINQGSIYKFITKPWEDDKLRSSIDLAFNQYELISENKRLGAELQRLNQELRQANRILENQAERRTRYSDFNLRTLQLTQQVLEDLPMAVVGVGGNGIVEVANLKAHELLMPGSGGIVGLPAGKVMPQVRQEIWAHPDDSLQDIELFGKVYEIKASCMQDQGVNFIKALVIIPK